MSASSTAGHAEIAQGILDGHVLIAFGIDERLCRIVFFWRSSQWELNGLIQLGRAVDGLDHLLCVAGDARACGAFNRTPVEQAVDEVALLRAP